MCLVKLSCPCQYFIQVHKSYVFPFHKAYWLPWAPLPRLFTFCVYIKCKWQNDNKTIKQNNKNDRVYMPKFSIDYQKYFSDCFIFARLCIITPHISESQTSSRSLGFWTASRGIRPPGTGLQSLSVKLGFWIPIVSGIPDSLSCIPKPRIQDSTN